MNFLFCSLTVLVMSILLICLSVRFKNICNALFLGSLIVASVLGLMAVFHVLISPVVEDLYLNIRMPLGEFYIGMDALSAFFLSAIIILFLISGIYGYGYLKTTEAKNLGFHYALYQFAFMAMMLVVVARNGILFLMAWEMVTLSSYFLITLHDERPEVTRAGHLFLLATHIAGFCLWLMFLIMASHSGSMNFDQMAACPFTPFLAGIIFILGLIGFGVKAGFIPLHIWLPHAHPAAPSHVSAVLSAVMIKIGIYGLMRVFCLVRDFPHWCAILLLLIGMISGVCGVLYALGQHEIKKLLAYHSIENIGIITLGLGIGLWGQIEHNSVIALIGYAGALLHVFNHAVFKGLLFLSAGSLIRSTHIGEIDRLGGLLKYLPWTGHLFLIGSLSICGLPLFNGFISEWLIFRGLFEGMFHLPMTGIILSSMGVIALVLMGGLAAACFAKAFGVMFLGNSRSIDNSLIKESPMSMCLPMAVLGVICVWIGFFPRSMVMFAFHAASVICSRPIPPEMGNVILSPLLMVIMILWVVVIITAILVFLKKKAMKVLPIQEGPTWGCGYSYMTGRMQYTASSFAESLLRVFRPVLGFKVSGVKPEGYFPKEAEVSSHVVEASEVFLFRPVFEFIKFLSGKLKRIQCGYTQLYLLYIFVFLLALLIWKMV
ncbi:MAG: hydrogenase [Candidatus Omnitrophica bacterium]|nr:hydrogenase [Candidatus Omnitrophota bacterium]